MTFFKLAKTTWFLTNLLFPSSVYKWYLYLKMVTEGFTEVLIHLSQATERRKPQAVLLFSLLCIEIRRSSVGVCYLSNWNIKTLKHSVTFLTDTEQRDSCDAILWTFVKTPRWQECAKYSHSSTGLTGWEHLSIIYGFLWIFTSTSSAGPTLLQSFTNALSNSKREVSNYNILHLVCEWVTSELLSPMSDRWH
jgi:hypothetical protein